MNVKLPRAWFAKQVLGIMVDGQDLHLAHLGWRGQEIVIYALESATLPRRLGKKTPAKSLLAAANETAGRDVFGLEDLTTEDGSFEVLESEEGDVSGTLLNIFTKYPLKKIQLAVNMPEGQASYYHFKNDFELKGKKFRKRLQEEIEAVSGGKLDKAVFDYFRTESGGLTAVVSEGSIPLLDELGDIKGFLPGGLPRVRLIETNDLALVNLVRLNFNLPSQQFSAIIYIGSDFSSVTVLKGQDPVSFIQMVREGYQSSQVCQTLFSKILLEMEDTGIPELSQVILAGEIGRTRAFDFFSHQFPEAKVLPITPGSLNMTI